MMKVIAKHGLLIFCGALLGTSLSHATTNATISAKTNTTLESLDFERCQVALGAKQVDALCATLKRAENPDQPDGKLIDLFVAKFPSRNPNPAADAFTLIQGGPGGSSVDLFITYEPILEAIRAERDIIVVDQRGTGRSNTLTCPVPSDSALAGEIDPAESKRLAAECIVGLDADLRFYTTSIAVQDLDAVRAAAGYDQLTIYGVSYGTRVAQHYLRRFPDRTRAAILDGVVHVGLNLAGGEIARRSQQAFDRMLNRCTTTPVCAQQFGDVRQKFNEVRARLKAQSIPVTLPHPTSGEIVTKPFSEQYLLAAARLMPYSTEQLALLPMMISLAYDENYTPLLAQALMVEEEFSKNYSIGMNNTVMCAEDAPYVDDNDLFGTSNTYFGNIMSDSIKAVCEVWPRGPIDKDFLKAFESDIPVLLMSGENDPITPPANGEIAQKMFRNSRHLIVPAHGHGVFARGCVPALASQFVETTELASLNTSCIERERATPFFVDFTGPTP